MRLRTKIHKQSWVTSRSLALVLVVTTFAVSGAIAIVTSRAATGIQPVGVGGDWNLVWNDEFNGTALDTTKWSQKEPWHNAPGFSLGNNSEGFCPVPATPDLLTFTGSTMKINALKKPINGYQFQSCPLSTRDKFNTFTHGYIEGRMKAAAGARLWSQFWLLGNGTGEQAWPKTGEIDIYEFVNNGSDGTPYYTVHWYDTACPWGHCQRTQDNPWPARMTDFASQFHTYGLKRTGTALEVYIDGVLKYKRVPTDRSDGNGPVLAPYLFTNPMHLLLTMGVGGDWGNDPNRAAEPGSFEVDYVRAWTPHTSGGTDTTAPVTSITAPVAGSNVSGSLTMAATATDNVGVTKVEFLVDGIVKGQDVTAPFEISFSTTTLSYGAHSLQTKAYDAAGNTTLSAPLNINVDNSVNTQFPDVMVTSVDMYPVSPVVGGRVVFSATIRNTGTVPTPAGVPVGVAFKVDSSQTHWAATQPLAAGETRIISATNSMTIPDVNYWNAIGGNHIIEAHVDDVNRFQESNENNNVAVKSITIGTNSRISQVNNLAAGKTFTTNTPILEDYVLDRINNQNEDDRWMSVQQDNVSVSTDLGEAYTVSKVSVLWAGDTTKNYEIQMSSDNIAWKTVATGVTNNTTPQLIDVSSFSASPVGRYFRILGKDRWNNAYGQSIWEVGIYGQRTLENRLGDANGDSKVNAIDLSAVLSRDGQNYPAADFNKDGSVGAADMAILLANWTW